MASTDVVRARIDGHIKEEATNVLAQMGLSVSDAIRMLLTRVAADKALPFDVNRAITQSMHGAVAERRHEKKKNV